MFVAELDDLLDLVVGGLLVVMHFKKDAIAHKLVALALDTAWNETTEHGCLAVPLLKS